jgi:hypothetical protein
MQNRPRRRRLTLAAGLILTLLAGALGASAQAGGATTPRLPRRPGALPAKPRKNPDYKMTVSPGLGRGYCRLGWFPVHVAIDARKEFNGEIVAAFRLGRNRPVLFETRRKVHLAAGSKKDYHLYLRHESPNAGRGQGVEVYLDDGSEVPGTSGFYPLELVPQTDYLVCVVSDKSNILQGIKLSGRKGIVNGTPLDNGCVREFKVAQPTLRSLPDRAEGYNGVDFLVLHETPLESDQLKDRFGAIIDFARGGGIVVLSSGTPDWFKRPGLRPLLSVKDASNAKSRDAATLRNVLKRRYGSGFGPLAKKMAVYDYRIPGFASDPARGTLAGRCGLGSVLVWRLNLNDPAVKSWPGLYNLWADLGTQYYQGNRAKPRPDWGSGYGYNQEKNPISTARQRVEMLNLASERNVSALLVVFIVVFYLVLVGPVNYFVLRRLDMRALSIVTIPLLAAVFVLITFAVGYISRGVTTVGRRVTVATVPSGGMRASCVTSQSVFPSGSMLVDIGTDGSGLMCPLRNPELGGEQKRAFATMSEAGYVLEDYTMVMWEMAHFEARSTRNLGGTITLKTMPNSSYVFTNNSSVKLEQAFVVSSLSAGKYAWLGDVVRGQTYRGSMLPWRQVGGRRQVRRTSVAPVLSLGYALTLWTRGELSNSGKYDIRRGEEGFAEQVAKVILKDPRLDRERFIGRPGMLLFARVRNMDEFEPIRLDGGSVRGEGINALVVFSERGSGK